MSSAVNKGFAHGCKRINKRRLDCLEHNDPHYSIKQFTLDDLELSQGSIRVPRCTIHNFSGEDCHRLCNLIDEKIRGLEWCNADDAGCLMISFYKTTMLTDEQIEITLNCLNAL